MLCGIAAATLRHRGTLPRAAGGGGRRPATARSGPSAHICFAVPDLSAAVRWFDENGVTFVKHPDQGKMRDVAFVKDPDAYWIEIVQPDLLARPGT
ncbi:MAG TPA: VOC family protein [Solimonas sp.]|nr:VOC family protein [Solimonas sp.]